MAKKYRLVLLILFLGFVPSLTYAANLSISPASGTFKVGDQVILKIVVSSGTPINAISGSISVPTSIFNIESISKAASILDFWVSEPNFLVGTGALNFEGVTLGGFQGGTGTVLTATLRATKIGSGTVTFTSGQVLANDGQGTDVTGNKTGATFSVEAQKETSKPTVPGQIGKPEAPQKPPTLTSPEIMLTKKFGEQAISGVSNYPEAQVLLTFIAQSGVKTFITGVADDRGGFLLLVPQTLKRGVYNVSAVVIKKDTTHSYTSNEITITVGNMFSDIGYEIWLLIILLILMLIYLIVRSYSYLQKNKKIKLFVKREAKEAKDIVHESFEALKKDADRSDIKEIKKDLSDAEARITKEIKDIEKT
jgi:hypothetical protein